MGLYKEGKACYKLYINIFFSLIIIIIIVSVIIIVIIILTTAAGATCKYIIKHDSVCLCVPTLNNRPGDLRLHVPVERKRRGLGSLHGPGLNAATR